MTNASTRTRQGRRHEEFTMLARQSRCRAFSAAPASSGCARVDFISVERVLTKAYMAVRAPTPDAFIDYWGRAEASERANAQLFLSELADLLDVPRPGNSHASGYTFEFPVKIPTGPGTHTDGRIDLYRSGCFVLKAKQFVTPQARADGFAIRRPPVRCRGRQQEKIRPSARQRRVG